MNMTARQAAKIMRKAFALHGKEKYAEAEALYRRIAESAPGEPESNRLLGLCLAQMGRHDEAEGHLQISIASCANNPKAWGNLAVVCASLGKTKKALELVDRVLATSADEQVRANATFTRGMLKLTQGDYVNGWKDYEAGFKDGSRHARHGGQQWDGGELGKDDTLLLWWEQGYGDTLQFVRLAQYAAVAAGCMVRCEVQSGLYETLACLTGYPSGLQIIPTLNPSPEYTHQCSLVSLPSVLPIRLDKYNPKPYIEASPMRVQRWRPEVEKYGGIPVGFCWKGNAAHPNDRNRSTIFGMWEGVLNVFPCIFHSLQLGESQHDFNTFEDLAGIIANLELVITVDTAVAHLAGALGKEVWLLLPYVAEWRWSEKSADTIWYEDMTLYRQDSRGDWAGVFERVERDLKERVS